MLKPISYDPAKKYEIRVYDVEYRRAVGESWLARIYQPTGTGPFPALLDVHGGAWSAGDRLNNAHADQELAATGIVVMAIDLRVAPEHPYPAQVADVNYATRWLKAHSGDFNADGRLLGGIASSSGGHTLMLSAMRPNDPRYSVLPLDEASDADATIAYIVALWPVLDSYARYTYAKGSGLERLVSATEGYFLTEEAMKEGNPQLILERGEDAMLPPTLIIQGTADNNVPLDIPRRFVEYFSKAGGEIELELFPGMPHGFAGWTRPEAGRALHLIKQFMGRRLAAYDH